MKYTGKKFKGIPIYSDPEIPKDTIYFLNQGKLIARNPRRYGEISGLYEPPQKLGILRRLKWHLWDNI